MPPRVLLIGNVSQRPFANNLLPPVHAFERAASVRVLEPATVAGFVPTGGAAPATVPAEAVARAMVGFQPDVVVCLAGGLALEEETRRRLRGRAVTVGIALSDPLGLPASLAIAGEFDLFYTQDPGSIEAYVGAGLAVRRCDLAVDPAALAPVRHEPDCDLVFVGKRTPYRQRVLERLARRFAVRVHGYAWDAGWTVETGPQLDTPRELGEALGRARVALELAVMDDAPAPWVGRWRITPRPFFAAACGVPSLIEASPTLGEFFVPDEEIATFDNENAVDAAFEALLADEGARREMGRRARERVVRDHTWDRRVAMVLADVASTRVSRA